jgi:hypothetical protein
VARHIETTLLPDARAMDRMHFNSVSRSCVMESSISAMTTPPLGGIVSPVKWLHPPFVPRSWRRASAEPSSTAAKTTKMTTDQTEGSFFLRDPASTDECEADDVPADDIPTARMVCSKNKQAMYGQHRQTVMGTEGPLIPAPADAQHVIWAIDDDDTMMSVPMAVCRNCFWESLRLNHRGSVCVSQLRQRRKERLAEPKVSFFKKIRPGVRLTTCPPLQHPALRRLAAAAKASEGRIHRDDECASRHQTEPTNPVFKRIAAKAKAAKAKK